MSCVTPTALLRNTLLVDAAIGSSIAVLHLGLPGLISRELGLPQELIVASGSFLAGFSLFLWVLVASARRGSLQSAWVWTVVTANLLWALGCLLLWVNAAVAPNLLGWGYVAQHGLVVLVLAALEVIGLRASRPAPPLHARPA